MSDGNEKLYDFVARSAESGQVNDLPSLTVQSEAEDADINTIVRRFGITGEMPKNQRVPEYGDFTGISDYRSALEAVQAADAEFMAMPADVRARFGNNPQFFLEFCSDQNNLPALVDLGLAIKRDDGSIVSSAGQPLTKGVSDGKVDSSVA